MKPLATFLLTVFCALALLGPGQTSHAQEGAAGRQDGLTLEAIHQRGVFAGRFMEAGTWDLQGPRQWVVLSDPSARIILRDLASGRQKQVVAADELIDPSNGRLVPAETVEPSPDGRWLLLKSGGESDGRARFYLFDLEIRVLRPLSGAAQPQDQAAVFSPDGTAMALVRDNNLFVQDVSSGREVRLTRDGREHHVLHGLPDRALAEELGLDQALSWSPDGSRVAWLQLDERRVPEVVMADGRRLRYPKAGERNAEARVCTAAWADPVVTCLDTGTWDPAGDAAAALHPSRPAYLARLGWTREPDPRIWVLRLNRAQDRVDLLAAQPDTGRMDTLRTDVSPWWVEVSGRTVTFLPDGDRFLWLGNLDGWRHLQTCSLASGSCQPVTRGSWEVADLLGVDGTGTFAWITSAMDNPLERHVYRVNLMDPGSAPVRITREAGVHAADLSPDGAWFIDRHSHAGQPATWTLRSTSTPASRPLEENHALRKLLGRMVLPQKEFLTLPAADSTLLQAWILRPTGFDSTASWPVLFYVYGGPDSQTVTDAWDQGIQRQMWHAWVAEKLGVVVVSVDPRGAGGRGRAFAGHAKGQLGLVVAADLAAAARHLAEQSWVDKERVGIWGWSFGGYATLMAMLGPEDSPFRMGVAVAPVTDWRRYTSIYTERYLSTPPTAPEAYEANSALALAGKLRDDQHLLLVHGDADENVHVEHTLRMADALQDANRLFDLKIYPGRTHSLSGQDTRLHLFSMISRYIEAHLVRTLQEADPPRFAPE